MTITWTDSFVFTYIIAVNYNGFTFKLDVTDSATCTPISGTGEITVDKVHIF